MTAPDRIIGARQAAEAGPTEIAPIVMWSYLAALVKEYDASAAEVVRLSAQVQAVRDLHQPQIRWPGDCAGCESTYPCPTVAALGDD